MFKYMARQPIFDRNNKIFGYELLFRNSESNFYPADFSSDEATKQLITNLLLEFETQNVNNNKPIFINFSKALLMSDIIFLLNPLQVVIEILEDTTIDGQFIDRIAFLKDKGYIFALDDYTGSKKFDNIIDFVDYVKVDLLVTSNKTQEIISKRLSSKILLGEKLENKEDFYRLKNLKYSLFQGFYFSKPQIIKTRALDISMSTYVRLLNIVKNSDCNFHELSLIIKQDVAMVNKLFKKVNTLCYSPLGYKIDTVTQALALLGVNEIKRWISIIMLQSVAKDDGEELIYTALLRAVFSEKIAGLLYLDKQLYDSAYYNGLFSVFHENGQLEHIFEEHFSLERKREVFDLILLTTYYENADWTRIIDYQNKLNLNPNEVAKAYQEALRYVDITLSL